MSFHCAPLYPTVHTLASATQNQYYKQMKYVLWLLAVTYTHCHSLHAYSFGCSSASFEILAFGLFLPSLLLGVWLCNSYFQEAIYLFTSWMIAWQMLNINLNATKNKNNILSLTNTLAFSVVIFWFPFVYSSKQFRFE